MACPAIITGDAFLLRLITHIDCQAQVIGSYGYQALGQPGSLASLVATGLLSLFVALFGLRLLFGPPPGLRDTVYDVLKLGLVLTLAFSWPAFRTLIYDVTFDAPAELASVIAGMPATGTGTGLPERLQAADNAMVRLAEAGTGRNTGALVDADAPGGTFAASTLSDEDRYASARLFWLAGIIGSLGLLRIAAGLLLALAPLAAMLLLFAPTRGLFAGWLRGLVLAILGSLGITLMLGIELAVIGPWLADALRLRALGYATPAAPAELMAMTLGFAIARFGLIWLLARVAFNRGWSTLPRIEWPGETMAVPAMHPLVAGASMEGDTAITRARQISDSVETLVRREEASDVRRTDWRSLQSEQRSGAPGNDRAPLANEPQRLGDSWRRGSATRSSATTRNRDSQP